MSVDQLNNGFNGNRGLGPIMNLPNSGLFYSNIFKTGPGTDDH